MIGEYVRTVTEDGLELQGLYCQAGRSSNRGVLHVHGLAGNFYENRFIDAIGNAVVANGYNFLTVNNRGHDYIADFLRKDGDGWKWDQIGAAHEIFEECVYDLRAWQRFLESRGCTEIVIEGHSSGAEKVVYYVSTARANLAGIILLSPSDDVGLQKEALKERYDNVLREAQERIERGLTSELMPQDAFEYPIDAKTYINMFGHETHQAVFEFSNSNRQSFKEVESITSPMLVLMGTQNEAVIGDVMSFLDQLKRHAVHARYCDTEVINGAPHSYLGYESQVASAVVKWLTSVFPPT